MKVLSHERARQLLHTLTGSITDEQQAGLEQHLAGCAQCQEYAATLRSLQPVIAQAMHARWDFRSPPSVSSRAIRNRWKQVRRKRQSGRLLVALAAVSVVVLLVVYGPALLAPLAALLNIRLGIPPPTIAPVPAVITATPTLGSPPTEGAADPASPPFTLALIAGSFSSPERNLITISSDGARITNLSAPLQIPQAYHPVWSPDSSKIAFLNCLETVDPDQSNLLYVINRDGSNLTSLEPVLSRMGVTPNCGDDSISWSPDGALIVFEGRSLNSPYYADIYIATAGADRVENLTEKFSTAQVVPAGTSEYPEWATEHFPTWSPDGSELAFVMDGEIYVVSAGGENLRKITDQQGDANSLNWTPDGRSIVYGDSSYSEIRIVSIKDGASRSVVDTNDHVEEDPDLSPDGRQVAYYSGYGGLYVVDIEGKNAKQIVSTDAFAPSWSPDGNFIAYKHPKDSGGQSPWYLSVISKDGSGGKQLIEIAMGNQEFSWSYFSEATQPEAPIPGLPGASAPVVSPAVIPALETPTPPTQEPVERAMPEGLLAFISSESADPSADQALQVVQSSGEGLKNLTEGYDLRHPGHFAWSPDGSRIAMIDCAWTEPERNAMLYVIRRDGSDLISMEELFNATGVSVDCSPISWSPDGQQIAVRAGPTPDQYSDILLVSAQGDSVENMTASLVYEDISACEGVDSSFLDACARERGFEQIPVWAPDGSALAVIIDNEIYLISVDGNSYRRLTNQPGSPTSFEWTPDSQHIVYSNADGDGQIYAVSVDTGEIRRIVEGSEPDLSPDGTRVAFTREATGIYTVEFSGENLDHIVAGPGYFAPRWTPDSQFISYLIFAGGKQTVSIVPRDGSWEKVVVEFGAFWNGEIAWSK